MAMNIELFVGNCSLCRQALEMVEEIKGPLCTLKVYDLLGRVVADLVSEAMRMGQHQVVFDGSNFPSGVYFYRLEFGGKSISKEFVLTK